VDRPAAQTVNDKPYVEIGITDQDLENSPDSRPPTADIVYVSFESAAAKQRASHVVSNGDACASCRPPGTTGRSR